MNILIENLLKLDIEDRMEIDDDTDDYAMEVFDNRNDDHKNSYMVTKPNAEDEEMSEAKPNDDDVSMEPKILENTDDDEFMELCDEPGTNVMANISEVKCMEFGDEPKPNLMDKDDDENGLEVMAKPKVENNVPRGLGSKVKKKKTWKKLKSGLYGWKALPANYA